jgi:hypothetical protein
MQVIKAFSVLTPKGRFEIRIVRNDKDCWALWTEHLGAGIGVTASEKIPVGGDVVEIDRLTMNRFRAALSQIESAYGKAYSVTLQALPPDGQ